MNSKRMIFIVTIATIVAIAIGSFPSDSVAEGSEPAEVTTGGTGTSWTGTGTDADPYVITTKEHLQELATNVNGGNSYADVFFKLEDDIDLGSAEWIPIGTSTNPFSGSLNGMKGDNEDHVISNLSITGSNDYVGLFGCISGGKIENLTLNAPSVSGGTNVGVLVGYVIGVCTFTDVDLRDITVSATGGCVGGLVGSVGDESEPTDTITITGCDLLAGTGKTNSITSDGNFIGGLVGASVWSTTSIVGCTTVSTMMSGCGYVGGIIGYAYKTDLSITDCGLTGLSVAGTEKDGDDATYIGGIVGMVYESPSKINDNTISGITATAVGSNAGGVIGRVCGNYKAEITGCHISGVIKISGAGYTSGIASRVEYYGNSISDCSVKGDEGSDSIIDGGVSGGYIGGIFSWIPEGKFGIKNCTVENIAINGGQKTGGIGGMLHYGNHATDLSLKNVTITTHGTSPSVGLLFGENAGNESKSPITIYGYKLDGVTLNGMTGPIISNIAYSGSTIDGGTFACANPVFDENGRIIGGTFDVFDATKASEVLSESYIIVAKIDGQYCTLQDAIEKAKDGTPGTSATIEFLGGTFELGTVQFPAELYDVEFVGAENKATVLKNTVIGSADGNTLNYQGIKFDGIVFENSHILFSGQRTGSVTYADWTITNCVFKNIDGTTPSSSPISAVHMNLDVDESMRDFVFVGNTIDGVTAASSSGLLIRCVNGDVTIDRNHFKNIAHNAIQFSASVGYEGRDTTLSIQDNEFSGIGDRAIRLGDITVEGTTVIIGGNSFTDVNLVENELIKATSIGSSSDVIVIFQGNTWVQSGTQKSEDEILAALVNMVPTPAVVAEVGGTEYKTLSEAISAASEGQAVTIVSNMVIDEVLDLSDIRFIIGKDETDVTKNPTVVIKKGVVVTTSDGTSVENYGTLDVYGTLNASDLGYYGSFPI